MPIRFSNSELPVTGPGIKYEAVIGLEVHCQLNTATKAFSPESASFGAEPNTNVDPVSLGHPGTLPVLNERVLSSTILMGLATNCRIRTRSTFARKHYFYPDLPKGYQISQYEDPICYDGWIDVRVTHDEVARLNRVGITRIHIEEDAGKSVHDQDPSDTLLDFNRCGIPLIEIVSEPVIGSPQEASSYLQRVRQIVRYLGISDGNMEEGSLRCDANVSVRPVGDTRLGTKTEVKNMNSFRSVERALEFEIERQIHTVVSGEAIVQETRLWDADALETRPMRSKEEAHDYRYFPDPDLVPIVVTESMIDDIRAGLPEMPDVRASRLVTELGLPEYDALLITQDKLLADMFDAVVEELIVSRDAAVDVAKPVSNLLMTDVLRVVKERGVALDAFPIEPARLAGLVRLRLQDAINSSAAQTLFDRMLEDPADPQDLASQLNLLQVSDTDALRPVVVEVLQSNEAQVQQYLAGKEGLLGFFVGRVMRQFSGSPDPRTVRTLLTDELDKRRGRGAD